MNRGTSLPLRIFAGVFFFFLLAPIGVVVIASFTNAHFVSFPPQGFSFRWYLDILRHPEFISAFQVSIIIASIVAPVSTILSICVGYALTQRGIRRSEAWVAFFSSPLMLPGVLLGLGTLQFFAAAGLAGGPAGLVIGHVVVTVPYALRLVLIGFAGLDPALPKAARTLGAGEFLTFVRIIFPRIRSAALAGTAFAFIMSFDDVAISLFLSRPNLVPIPIAVFNYLDQSFGPVVTAVSSVLVLATALVVVVIERFYGVGRLFGAGEKR